MPMLMFELLKRDIADADEERATYEEVWECQDSARLLMTTLRAQEPRWRREAVSRLTSLGFRNPSLRDGTLRKIADQSDDPNIRLMARHHLAFSKRDDAKATLFNQNLIACLYLNREEIDFGDEHVADLVEYVMPQREIAPSPITKERARRLHGMLPTERRGIIDGMVGCRIGNRSDGNLATVMEHRYRLVRRLMKRETDIDRMEVSAIGGGDGWISSFSLARLTGWRACPDGNQAELCTFECDGVTGYPDARRKWLIETMVEWERLDADEANRLLVSPFPSPSMDIGVSI